MLLISHLTHTIIMSILNTLKLPKFYLPYVELVSDQALVQGLITLGNESIDLYRGIKEESADYRYAEGKWSIKQVLTHIIDAERVFSFRAFAFSRNDKNSLPGFDQEVYIQQANVEDRRLHKIVDEFANVRASTVDMFSSLSEDMLERVGNASGADVSVRALGYMIMGHAEYHRKIINERYLG